MPGFLTTRVPSLLGVRLANRVKEEVFGDMMTKIKDAHPTIARAERHMLEFEVDGRPSAAAEPDLQWMKRARYRSWVAPPRLDAK